MEERNGRGCKARQFKEWNKRWMRCGEGTATHACDCALRCLGDAHKVQLGRVNALMLQAPGQALLQDAVPVGFKSRQAGMRT